MKNKLMLLVNKLLLRKHAVIENVNDQLKSVSHVGYKRHRSVWNFMANILATLIAYALQPKKTFYCFEHATVVSYNLTALSIIHVKQVLEKLGSLGEPAILSPQTIEAIQKKLMRSTSKFRFFSRFTHNDGSILASDTLPSLHTNRV